MAPADIAGTESLQCTNPSKHPLITASLQKVLKLLCISDAETLLAKLVTTDSFLLRWTAYRDAYLLHPHFNEEGLNKGGDKMYQLFEHIRREVNGRSAKMSRLGEGASGRAHTVRLFSSLVKSLTGEGGFYDKGDKDDEVWLSQICEQLYGLVKHLRGEYAHGHGVLMDAIEEKKPCIWLNQKEDELWETVDEEEDDVEERSAVSEDDSASDDFQPSESEKEEEPVEDDSEDDLNTTTKAKATKPPTPPKETRVERIAFEEVPTGRRGRSDFTDALLPLARKRLHHETDKIEPNLCEFPSRKPFLAPRQQGLGVRAQPVEPPVELGTTFTAMKSMLEPKPLPRPEFQKLKGMPAKPTSGEQLHFEGLYSLTGNFGRSPIQTPMVEAPKARIGNEYSLDHLFKSPPPPAYTPPAKRGGLWELLDSVPDDNEVSPPTCLHSDTRGSLTCDQL